jgi:hypothetical protein
MIVSIKSISRQPVIGSDGKKSPCNVAELHGNKPFILNATNQKTLTKLFGSPIIQSWYDKPITVYVTQIRVAGENVDALRIRPTLPIIAPQKPENLPVMHPEHDKWSAAKEAVALGKTTIEAIRKQYILSPENEALLNAGIQNKG